MSERIGRERLDEILENHRMWWASGGKEGVRANLVGAIVRDKMVARSIRITDIGRSFIEELADV